MFNVYQFSNVIVIKNFNGTMQYRTYKEWISYLDESEYTLTAISPYLSLYEKGEQDGLSTVIVFNGDIKIDMYQMMQ